MSIRRSWPLRRGIASSTAPRERDGATGTIPVGRTSRYNGDLVRIRHHALGPPTSRSDTARRTRDMLADVFARHSRRGRSGRGYALVLGGSRLERFDLAFSTWVSPFLGILFLPRGRRSPYLVVSSPVVAVRDLGVGSSSELGYVLDLATYSARATNSVTAASAVSTRPGRRRRVAVAADRPAADRASPSRRIASRPRRRSRARRAARDVVAESAQARVPDARARARAARGGRRRRASAARRARPADRRHDRRGGARAWRQLAGCICRPSRRTARAARHPQQHPPG